MNATIAEVGVKRKNNRRAKVAIRSIEGLDSYAARLEKEHPGKTIVLNAKTREILIASQNSTEIAKTLRSLSDDIVTLFIGGPRLNQVGFHHFC
jgi:23S rRNA pseudoU1915 N3-methylase RlmH